MKTGLVLVAALCFCACSEDESMTRRVQYVPDAGELGVANASTPSFVPELACERRDTLINVAKVEKDNFYFVSVTNFCPVICVRLRVREVEGGPVLAELKLADPTVPDETSLSFAGCRPTASDFSCHVAGFETNKCVFYYGPVPGTLKGRLNVYMDYDVYDQNDPNCSWSTERFTPTGKPFGCAKGNFE